VIAFVVKKISNLTTVDSLTLTTFPKLAAAKKQPFENVTINRQQLIFNLN